MATISVDFNARAVDGRVRLDDPGARRSIEQAGVKPGDWVWLTDNDVRAGGVIEEGRDGLRARVAWETLEDVIPEGDERRNPEDFRRAIMEFVKQTHSSNTNFREVLRVLPLIAQALPPGTADACRARAALAFGYPNLAILAIEEALHSDPAAEEWIQFKLHRLSDVDLERANYDAEAIISNPEASAFLLLECAGVLGTVAQILQGDEARNKYLRLVEVANRLEIAPGREQLSADQVALAHQLKGIALSRLGDKAGALSEFDNAIRTNPKASPPYAARGIETYPSEQSISDLHKAIEHRPDTFWPAYYLTHHYVRVEEWTKVTTLANTALTFEPPPAVKANLFEWLAIAAFQGLEDVPGARDFFLKALELAPESSHLISNFQDFKRRTHQPAKGPAEWELVQDVQGHAYDIPQFAA